MICYVKGRIIGQGCPLPGNLPTPTSHSTITFATPAALEKKLRMDN